MEAGTMTEWARPQCPVLAENIPQTLKDLDRWVVWKWEPGKDRSKKWRKPPRQPSGAFAATNKPETWSSFEQVLECYQVEAEWDGIGIVLPPSLIGADLDECVKDGKLNATAQLCVSQMDTYTEFSPSGTGIKMIAAGKLNEDLPRGSHEKGLELYDEVGARYFTTHRSDPRRRTQGNSREARRDPLPPEPSGRSHTSLRPDRGRSRSLNSRGNRVSGASEEIESGSLRLMGRDRDGLEIRLR